MAETTLPVAPESRYKLAKAYIDEKLGPVFGPLPPIEEFYNLGASFKAHRVASQEVGFLDALAVRYWGDGTEQFWWVIAYANDLLDPEKEMFPGQVLYIPTRTMLDAFLRRRPDGLVAPF